MVLLFLLLLVILLILLAVVLLAVRLIHVLVHSAHLLLKNKSSVSICRSAIRQAFLF